MRRFSMLLAVAIFASAGCNDNKTTPPASAAATEGNSKIKANLDKLSPEDRALAEAQGKCPISKEPLGTMGTPVKLMLKDKPVFVCCKNCQKEALANPDETLKKVDELKHAKGE